MQYCQRFTEVWELLGADADEYTPGTYAPLAFRSLGNHQRAALVMHVGDMGAGATVDLTLLQATNAAGTDAKAIAGKAITRLTQASGDAGSTVVIEVRTEEMDVDNRFAFIGAELKVANANCDIGIVALAGSSNYVPVATTSWDEIVD